MPFPFRFKRCHIDNDATTSVRAFTQADDQDISWNAEIFNGTSKRKGVRRNNADILLNINKTTRVKCFGIYNR